MSSTADVTVIIPCYRSEKTIQRAIESVMSQSVLPKKIVLVIDGGPIDSIRLTKQVCSTYGSIVQIEELVENKGAAFARNHGWNLAKTEFIAFLDSDDAWSTKKIELQYAYMVKNPGTVLTGHPVKLMKDDAYAAEPVYGDYADRGRQIKKWDILFRNILPTPSVMLRRDLNFRFDINQRSVDDHLLWMRIILGGKKAFFSPQPLAFIYKPFYGAGGLSANLIEMEKNELLAYRAIFKLNLISLYELAFVGIISILKFMKRVLHVGVRALIMPK